jgi:tetratricopeptide (TPR) repeat protein
MSHLESNAKHNTKAKLTLYMIGHAPDAKYLERLLKQVKPIIAQVCFVCTDKKPDCRNVLESSGIPFDYDQMTFKKRNQFDFSKARNAARQMACQYSCQALWLDCDDTIQKPENIIKGITGTHQGDAYAIYYNVSVEHSQIIKIRVHDPRAWEWVGKIHEEITPIDSQLKDKKILLIKNCQVDHSPDEHEAHHEFHIDLLREGSKKAPDQFAYIAKEYYCSRKYEEAIPWFNKTIPTHSDPIQIYDAYVSLGVCYLHTGQVERALRAFHDGLEFMPGRKEAYFRLAEYYASQGKVENMRKAFSYIRACNAQPTVTSCLQNDLIYKNLCWSLHARLHMGRKEYKEAIEVANKATLQDPEIEQIKDECTRAIEQNNISNGSS